jgi:hypothetical protein
MMERIRLEERNSLGADFICLLPYSIIKEETNESPITERTLRLGLLTKRRRNQSTPAKYQEAWLVSPRVLARVKLQGREEEEDEDEGGRIWGELTADGGKVGGRVVLSTGFTCCRWIWGAAGSLGLGLSDGAARAIGDYQERVVGCRPVTVFRPPLIFMRPSCQKGWTARGSVIGCGSILYLYLSNLI